VPPRLASAPIQRQSRKPYENEFAADGRLTMFRQQRVGLFGVGFLEKKNCSMHLMPFAFAMSTKCRGFERFGRKISGR